MQIETNYKDYIHSDYTFIRADQHNGTNLDQIDEETQQEQPNYDNIDDFIPKFSDTRSIRKYYNPGDRQVSYFEHVTSKLEIQEAIDISTTQLETEYLSVLSHEFYQKLLENPILEKVTGK